MIRRREKMKKENLMLTSEIFEKRYHSGDFEGRVLAEVQAQKAARLALQPNQVNKPNIDLLHFCYVNPKFLQVNCTSAVQISRYYNIFIVLSVLWKPLCRELGKQTSPYIHFCFDGNVNRKRKETKGEETKTREHPSTFKKNGK